LLVDAARHRDAALPRAAQSESALRIARFLAAHPAVENVYYPGLPSHPQHAVAARQMKAFGGMLSFQVRGGAEDAMRVAASVEVFTRATSLVAPIASSSTGPPSRVRKARLRPICCGCRSAWRTPMTCWRIWAGRSTGRGRINP